MSKLASIAAVASAAVNILKKSEETSFKELKKREKKEIYRAMIESTGGDDTWQVDGDSDGYSESYRIDPNDDNKIVFFSNAEYYEDIPDELRSVQFELYYDDAPSGEATDLEWFQYIATKFAGDTQVINLTPHDVVVVDYAGSEIKRYPANGSTVRVNSDDVQLENVDGVMVVRTEYTDVDGLPDAQPNTVYLVSVLVAQALKGSRSDVYTPDTGPKSVVRNEQGHIIGVQRLMQL